MERLPAFAVELVGLGVDAIVATGTPAALAARSVTKTIHIVFATAAEPVDSGLVASLARPGGNVTGLSLLAPEITARQLQLLKEAVPKASRVAVLSNPTNSYTTLTAEPDRGVRGPGDSCRQGGSPTSQHLPYQAAGRYGDW